MEEALSTLRNLLRQVRPVVSLDRAAAEALGRELVRSARRLQRHLLNGYPPEDHGQPYPRPSGRHRSTETRV
jgi:hypothetical protein